MQNAKCKMQNREAHAKLVLHSAFCILHSSGSVGVKNEIGDFLDYLTYERNVSVNTIEAYRDDLEAFVGFLCNDYFTLGRDQLDLHRVDHLTIRAFLAHQGRRKLARASIARELSCIRSFFK